MSTNKFCCFKGRGEISLVSRVAALAALAGLMPVGNASQFDITITEKVDSTTDYTSPAGGVECVSREIERVDLTIALECHNLANLSRAMYAAGAQDNVASAAVANEPKVLWPGALLPLDGLLDDTVPVVVKSPDGVTTYVLGVDYLVTPAGSLKQIVGGAIPEPTVTSGVGQPNVKVSYTTKTHTLLQMFSKISDASVLHFDGYNIAGDTVVPQQFDLFNVKFQATDKLELIGQGLSKLTLKGWALRDTTKPLGTLASPLSQYGTLKI